MLCKETKSLQFQSFDGVCAAGADGWQCAAGAVDVYVAGADGQRMRDERQTSGAAGRLRCRTVCTKHKTRLPTAALFAIYA